MSKKREHQISFSIYSFSIYNNKKCLMYFSIFFDYYISLFLDDRLKQKITKEEEEEENRKEKKNYDFFPQYFSYFPFLNTFLFFMKLKKIWKKIIFKIILY